MWWEMLSSYFPILLFYSCVNQRLLNNNLLSEQQKFNFTDLLQKNNIKTNLCIYSPSSYSPYAIFAFKSSYIYFCIFRGQK